MAHSYVSLTSFKSQLGDTTTARNALYREKLEAASEKVDEDAGRTFRVYLATLYLTAKRADRLLLPVDLLSLTSLKTDDDGDRTYENTWDVAGADADVDLMPSDADVLRLPYWELATTPNGDYSFPAGVQKGVEVVAKCGFREELVSAGTLGAAIDSTTTTSVTMAAGHGIEALQTILVGSEQLYVTAVATNTLTVERAANGTTAATHLIGAAVSRYRYPRVVVEATAVLAEEMLRPFGVHGRTDDTAGPVRPQIPHYVPKMIESVRLARVA